MSDRNETDAIEARIAELKLEHRDLDDVIFRLTQSPVIDQLQLQRMKKRKLMVKDQIALLERQLTVIQNFFGKRISNLNHNL